MPISAGGGNQSYSSSSGSNAVELVISAKNDTGNSFDKLSKDLEAAKKKTEEFAGKFEKLEDKSDDAFKSIKQGAVDLAHDVFPKLRQAIDITAKSFNTFIGTADKSLSTFNGVFEAIDNVYELATSDVTTTIFTAIAAGANQAIGKVASLSSILNALRGPNLNLAKGIGGAEAIDKIYGKIASISPLLDSIDSRFSRTVKVIRDGSNNAVQGLDVLTNGIGALSNISAPLQIFAGLQETIGGSINAVSEVSQRVFFFMGALEQLKGVVLGGPFELLIGQNIRLQEQLLGIQATLAATTRLMRDGLEVGGGDKAVEKILGLAAPVNSVLTKIRQDSLKLVGVTSNELVDVFNLVTQSMTDVNISLKQAGDLTISFAASLGTLGIPLYQARQEIQSILQGQIDQNSALAKAIGLTNSQVKLWISQDKVFERLTERLAAFKEGNALAAQTVGGLTSNIREIAEEIGRAAGSKFLTPIVNQIGEIYRYLLKNQGALKDIISGFLDRFAGAFSKVRDGFVSLFTAVAPLGKEIIRLFGETLVDVVSGIGDGLKNIAAIATPFLGILGEIAKFVASTPFISLYAQIKLLSAGFGIAVKFLGNFATTVPILSHALALLQGRTLPLVNAFANLSAAFGGNVSAAVTLGAALTNIPFVLKGMSVEIERSVFKFADLIVAGRALQGIPLAKFFAGNQALVQAFATGLAAATPSLLNFAKTGLAMAKNFGIGRTEIIAFTEGLPTLIKTIATSSASIPIFGQKISGLLTGLTAKYATQIEALAGSSAKIFDEIETQIQAATIAAGANIRKMVISFGLWTGAAFLAGNAVYQLFIQNENLRLAIGFLVDKIKELAKFLGNALSSPLGIITSAVVALTIAIKTGLFVQLKNMAVATANAISPQLVPALRGIVDAMRSVNKVYDGFVDRLRRGTSFQESLTQAIKKNAETQKQAGLVTGSEAQQRLAEAQGRAQINPASFGDLLIPPVSKKARRTPYRAPLQEDPLARTARFGDLELDDDRVLSFGDVDLGEDRLIHPVRSLEDVKLRDSLADVRLRRVDSPAKLRTVYPESGSESQEVLSSLEKARSIVSQFVSESGGKLNALASTIKAGVVKNFDALRDSIKNVGKAIQSIDLQKIVQSLGKVSQAVFTELRIGLVNAKAAAIDLATSLKAGITAGIAAIGEGLAAAGTAAAEAGEKVAGFLIEFAPLAAIGVAIGAVITLLTNWAAAEAKKNAGLKEYNDRLKETIASLDRIKNIQGGTKDVAEDFKPKTQKELEAFQVAGESGVREVRSRDLGRNWFQQGWDRNFAPFFLGGDINDLKYEKTSTDRLMEGISGDVKSRLSTNPYAKDESGLNPQLVEMVRQNQKLTAEIAQLNKEGKDEQARLKQAELEQSNTDLANFEKTFNQSKENLQNLDLSGDQSKQRDALVSQIEHAMNLYFGIKEGTIAPMKPIESGTGTAINLVQYQQSKEQYKRGGDPGQQERYAQLMLGSSSELVKQGQLDPMEAIDSLKKLATSTTIDAKTAQAAQEQIAQFWQVATQRILQSEENRQSGLDLLRQKGQVSEKRYLEESLAIVDEKLQKQKELSLKSEKDQVEIIKTQEREQLRVIRQELKKELDDIQAAMNDPHISKEDRANLLKSLDEAKASSAQRELDIQNATEKQLQQLRLDYEKEYTAMMIDAEKQRQNARIAIVQQAQDKLNDQLSYSEEVRNQNLTKLTNEGLLFDEEANLIRLSSTDRRITREIEAEKALRNERMKTPALFEKEIRQSDIKIAQLTQQRLENEGKAWDTQLAALKRNLKYRVDAYVNAVQEENKNLLGQQKYFDAMQNTLNTRNELLGAAKSLVNDTSDAIAGSYSALSNSDISQNNSKIEQNLAEIAKLETLQKSVELEKQMFETQLAQNKLALERQQIELELKEIEQQRVILEKKAALEVAQKAAEAKPGDRQAQLDYKLAAREFALEWAALPAISDQKTLVGAQLDLFNKTADQQRENNNRKLDTALVNQEIAVAKSGNPLQNYRLTILANSHALQNSFGISKEEADRLARDPDARNKFLRDVRSRAMGNAFPGLQGERYGINDVASERRTQQGANLNLAARAGATNAPSLSQAEDSYNQIFGEKIPTNPGKTETGKKIDDILSTTKSIDGLTTSIETLGKDGTPTLERLTDNATDLIEKKYPELSAAIKDVSEAKIPTTTSVLGDLGTRLQQFSEKDLPGVAEAFVGVQKAATSSIDTIVSKLDEETKTLTDSIGAQFAQVWDDLLKKIVLPPSSNTPAPDTADQAPKVLTPEERKQALDLKIQAQEMVMQGNQARVDQALQNKQDAIRLSARHTPKGDAAIPKIPQYELEAGILAQQNVEEQKKLDELRRQQAALPSVKSFAPTKPAPIHADYLKEFGNWMRSWGGGGQQPKNQQAKTFTANITVAANTSADSKAIGSEVAKVMRDVFYKTGEVTA